MKYKKLSKWINKSDVTFNLDKFGKTDNVIFITGLFGSGKSFSARNLAKKYNAIHIQQDWLSWSNEYDNPESKFFVSLFKKKCPETCVYFEKNMWHDQVDLEEKRIYREKYDLMILEYMATHRDKLFIYEGGDILNSKNNIETLKGRPLIIKRTSVRKSFLNLKLRDKGKIGVKDSYVLWKKYRKYYLRYHKMINKFIKDMTGVNIQNF